ncbi:glycosyltransferase family 2 protein [Armillaria novae-zelandiae]|uniref:dolichyl-phosphate beta-glucosyltransferase n=1 Tax=Armillaria novae-zelandiae TaxID=153914 RepID=A0AA39UML9_9AGAR|nr:glycosyltransferase family 2 protein [Armillaria novae-zelandiae]
METSTIVYAGLAAVFGTVISMYIALVAWSPDPIITRDSEKKYRSHKHHTDAQPLPLLSDPSTVDLSVVIPAYNETERLPIMLASAIDHLSQTTHSFEVLIIDDGSSDDTSAASLSLAGKYPKCDIRVVTLEKNLGKGGAVRHGMLYAGGERLLMVDADGANCGAGVVVGSRAHLVRTDAVVRRSLLRNILMYGLHTILRIVGVGHIRDTQCGFKLFSRSAAQQIFPHQHLPTWIFDVELLLLAKQLCIPVAEVPIDWHEVPGSKLNVVTASLQMLRDLLIVRANHLLGRWKASSNKVKSD